MAAHRTQIVLITVTVIVALAGCKYGDTEPDDAQVRFYSYKAYDSSNTIIDKGWLLIDFKESDHITGSWGLEKTGNGELVGQ